MHQPHHNPQETSWGSTSFFVTSEASIDNDINEDSEQKKHLHEPRVETVAILPPAWVVSAHSVFLLAPAWACSVGIILLDQVKESADEVP